MIWKSLCVLAVATCFTLTGCEQLTKANTADAARAEAAIGEAIEARGGTFSGLPKTNSAAIGPLAFSYHPQEATISVSVLITELSAWTLFPDRRPAIEKTIAALKDPAIGGRFQTDGAVWKLDRMSGKITLGHTFPATANAHQLVTAATSLERLAPHWSLHWIGAVGDIVHEGAPIPAQQVTIENNPYRQK